MSEDSLKNAVSIAIKAGYQLDQNAFDFMKTLPPTIDPKVLMQKVIEKLKSLREETFFIDMNMLESESKNMLQFAEETNLSAPIILETGKKAFHPYSKDIETDLRVIEDPTESLQTSGTLEDYIEYFRDRFRRMSRLLRQRMDAKDAKSLSEVLKSPNGTKAKILCMISEKRETKRGIFLTVEDMERTATVYFPLDQNRLSAEKAKTLLLDQVVCISITKGRNDLLIADDIILPDVPSRKANKAPIPVYAALISDLHIGSKMFMEREFQHFILWLKGKFGDENARRIASHVKYVIVAGDIVDGVGIYPQQIDELSIKDIYKQYEASAKILQGIPEYIEVIIIPGNHDATRKALPQPAIPRKYAEPLYETRKIHSLGDPSKISLHGVNILLSHGRSLDDVISLLPNMSFREPEKAMTFLLQCRHLAPTYGMRTPIASNRKDCLIIENVPDIFHAGHVHMMRYNTYRSIVIVNSGAWQSQTEYQMEMGHVPNPGIVPIVNLQTLEVMPVDFRSDRFTHLSAS